MALWKCLNGKKIKKEKKREKNPSFDVFSILFGSIEYVEVHFKLTSQIMQQSP